MSLNIRTGRHCVFTLHAHLVFVTKYRKAVFTQDIFISMEELMRNICKSFDVKLIEFNGEYDHVHLLVHYPPKVMLSKLVNSLKGASSRKLRLMHEEIRGSYYKGVLWSPSYFAASCGGAPLDTIKQYIQSQNTPSA